MYVYLQHKKRNAIVYTISLCILLHFIFFCVESILPNHVTIVYVVVGKSYFHHQTTHHHHHKFMISTCPLEKKLIHNFEVFPFKTWYHIALNLLYSVSCISFFKSNLVLFAINHDQQSYILLFLNLIFLLHEYFWAHTHKTKFYSFFLSFSFWCWCPLGGLRLKVWINITLSSYCLDFRTFVKS
jgi:hypothetical protein